jgi:hypothetical protein
MLGFQYVEAASKNGTSIHADAADANQKNHFRNRRATIKPKIVPRSESSEPHSSTL